MNWIFVSFFFISFASASPFRWNYEVDSSLSDGFVGPFPDWINIKTNFSAKGDGITG